MKRIILAVLIMACASTVMAQTKFTLASSRSYATTDTTNWVGVNLFGNYALTMAFNDSVNVSIRLDYRAPGASSTAKSYQPFGSVTIVGDSTNSTNANGYIKHMILRYATIDSIPAAGSVRLIVTRKTTGNGVSSPTYSAYLWRE